MSLHDSFVRFLLNSWIGRALNLIMVAINRLVPKRDNQILFESIPDFSDNPSQLYSYIKSLGTDYRMIWVVDSIRDDIDAPQYLRNTPSEFWQFLRSRYIVSSHGYHLMIRAGNQVYLNLWHGMPLKAMGYTEREPSILLPGVCDENYYLIATSTIMRNALAACFNQDARRIHITGQPRNDKLLTEGRTMDDSRTIILYTPTYRDTGRDESIFSMPDYSEEKFQDFLREHDAVFLMKLHPLDSGIRQRSGGNIRALDPSEDLYDILQGVDVLVTDYSSVYFDFLLLDRPVIFAVPDLEEYRRVRGFVLEPFEFWAPGPRVETFSDFLEELERCLEDDDYYRRERRIVNSLVNQHQDGESSRRVYELVWGD
ncbi:CDP-glycerol glycerophosphotransferase family protein [Methanothermobacter thermautotrophicus]|jgi:CDP-glycerol glycerophosphotransferase (TagB/SpsB family)|uniref:CDP-glycerol glycerophosphotransferase family protein n=1 Tax=Methanothermobacter thermautotrophicus TaxID=145262 RepID=UPI0022B9A478|nr:CDP-glycerol glycerophosphotransferase family protein [Methanothermobacter thermautotrophicus]MDI6818593.1 CDP-glycerol glycerophosphotransferase family protein [Methanothermobacter thermautotrophicus]WBF08454.1 CDP-glycerol glycerophosphotransferase family protein [Methanothermobacter thermautotrophicus]